MATETHIQDFLHSKKGEREDDDVVLSEIMEEKVTEFNGNKMKELEKSNEVVESVNTEKETEGGNFFQALADPVVIVADDEDSSTPKGCKAATTEDQEERGSTMIEGSKEELQDEFVESQEEQVEYEDEVKKHSDISNVEINEKPTTFLSKNEDQERKENVVTSSQDGTFEGNESEVVKTKEECIREDNENTTLKKDIIKEELESLKIDPQEDKREQESTESVNKTVQTYSELKQEEGTEVLQPSIETEEKTEHLHTVTTDDCIKSEKESQVELKEEVKENEVYVSEKDEDFITSEDAKCEEIKESTIGQRGTTMASFEEEPEEKSIDAQEARELIVETTENEEKARVNDDGQTEKSESLLVKEVSEVKVSERAESELNENEIVSKEEIQEKEKSLKMSEEEEKTIDPQEASGSSEEIVTKIEQSSSEIEQEEDTEETKASVEKGQQACEEEEKYYDTETTMKEVSEEAVLEKVEGLKFYDSLDITLNEKVEDEVKEQEVYASRDGGEDVTSSTPREILNDKSSDVQEASEQYESGVNEKIEQVPEEENVNENEEIKPSVETYEKEEVKIIGNEEDVIEKVQFEGVELSNKDDEQEHIILEEDQGKDDVTCLQDPISIQEDLPKTKYDGEGKEPEFVEPRDYIEEDTKEIKSSPEIKDDIKIGEKAIVDNDGQSLTNKSESPENAESELNADEILSNEEIQEKKKEVKMLEDVDVYDDDIIISHNESSKDMKETNIDQHVTTMTSFEEGQDQEDKKEQKLEETTDSKIVESCLEIEQEEDTEEIKPSVETEVRTDSGNGQKENVDNSSFNEETDSQNVEHSEWGKETASKIENEENEQEVCMSGKEGGRDDVTSSQDATCEDVKEPLVGQDVTPVVYLEEGHAISSMPKEETAETEENNEESIEKDDGQMEKTFIPSVKEVYEETTNKVSEEGAKGMETFKDEYQEKDKVESVNVIENKEEIKPSVETYETKEHEEIPRHEKEMIETRENTEEVLYSVETKEMEENIEKEAIINDYGQTNTSESPLVEDVCEVIGSENVESEEGIKDFESSSRALNPDEIVMKEENQEKEQEPEEVKEIMIGQHVNTVVDFEAGKDQSEMTKETLKEEAADKSSDAHEASGEYESEANEKIEQKPEEESIDKYENSEEIKPSVELYETKEQVKTKCNKEDVSENVKLEGVEHSDKYENQERIISEEGKDDVTCLQDAISIQEDLPKTIYDGEGKEPKFVKPREFIEEDTKEIKPSVETEQQEVLHVVTTDKCITPQTESQVGNEVKSGEPIQSGDDEKENVDNSTDLEKVEYGEEVKEITSNIENEEKEHEVYMSGKDQGGEDVKEPIFGQHVTMVAYLEEEQAQSSISKEEIVKIDEKNKESIESNDGQMEKTLIPLVNEVYEKTSKEVCDETISKNIESKEGVKSLETFKDEDQEINKIESLNVIENIEEIKPSMETYELKEEKEITRREKDVIEARENIDEDIEEVIDSVETKEMEEKIEEETIVNDYGQTKTSESPLVKEVCEVMGSEDVVESEEGLKDFESSNRALNQDEMVMKEENQEKDEEPEEVKETTIGQHVSTVVDVEERQDQSEITKEILNEEAEDKSSDVDEDKTKQNHEESFNKSLQSCSEIKQEEDIVDIVKIDNPIQIDDGQKENVNGSLVNEVSEEVKETVNENENGSKVEDEEKEQEVFMSEEGHALNSMPKEETTKTEEKNEECIEMDDGEMEKTLIPSVKEVYEETSSKNVEYEGVKALQTFKDQDQDKDNVTNSQVVGLEEDEEFEVVKLEEDEEFEVVKTRKIMEEEDMEEIRSSVETTEDTDVITTDACKLTEKDTKEEAMENEEKIEEETIVNEDGQNGKFESPLVKEVCEVTSSEKVESVLNENKIVIKEENEEKEHELKMLEVVQGGVDDVASSQDATCEDIKELTIGQHESALTKEVLMEEAKDKPIDAQEVNEEYDQNEEKDKTEESANIILHSGSEEIPSVEIDENKQREVSEKDLQVNEHGFVEKGENMKEEDNEDVIKTYIDTEEKLEQEETTETTEEKNKEPITTHVKEIEAFKDEDQVNMSTESQSEDYVANSHVAGIEEDLQIKKYQEEEKEPELVEKNGESKEEEDTKEIKSSVETIETLENEERIEEEEAIVNDDGQTEKSESILVKEVSEVTISKKAESELNENEQKVKMSEKVKDTSQNTSNEDIKDIKETKDSNEISKDVILTKEIEQVPLETEKEKETNDLKEQIVEKDSHSTEDQKANVISEIDESPKQALESVCDVQTPEVVIDSEDFKVKEDSIEVRTNEVSNSENLEVQKELKHVPELVTEEDQVMENIILTSNEKELSDEVLLELGQPKEEIIEDEITKEDENISHENDNYDTKAEEEKCIQDEIIRETVSVEELNDGLNEASKEKSMELNETPATYGDEEKETVTRDFSIDENLGLQEGLKPASESAIEEDQVKEAKHGSEQSDITYENIIKHTSEKDLADGKRDMEEDVTIAPEKTQIDNTENQNETIKNVILTDEVAVDTEKETENNVKDSPTELDNTSTSTINQKELSDEIDYSKATPAVNNEVKTESRTDLGNIQAAEVPNLEFVKKEKDDELVSEIQTPETTVKMEMKEEVLEATNDTCETLTDGSLSEKKLVSMVPPNQELTSSTTEDQANELGLETDNTKVEHINISNKDQNLEFTNKEFPDILVAEEKEDENKEKETVGKSHPTEVYDILPENVPEASFIEKNEPETTTTNEKFTSEVDGIDVEKHEKAFDYTTGVVAVDDISKKEAGLESINQETYQSELKKEADENIEREIPTEKEPKEFDAYVTKDTIGTDELETSQKNKTDDHVKINQTNPEVQKYEPQSSSEVFTEEKKTSNEETKGNSEVAEHLTEERENCLKEETGEKGAKTEEENEEDDDENNQTNDAPVMVEASKDIEVKAHKKSHNILSGVGSKVKHSYAKVKKAITGKSSSPKASSP